MCSRRRGNLAGRKLAILVLPTTSWPKLEPNHARILSTIESTTPGITQNCKWREAILVAERPVLRPGAVLPAGTGLVSDSALPSGPSIYNRRTTTIDEKRVVLCWCNVIVVALLSRIWVGPNDAFRNSPKLRASRGDSEMTARH